MESMNMRSDLAGSLTDRSFSSAVANVPYTLEMKTINNISLFNNGFRFFMFHSCRSDIVNPIFMINDSIFKNDILEIFYYLL